MKHSICLLFVLAGILLHILCSPKVVIIGGSGTEVIGKCVDTLNQPVNNASILFYKYGTDTLITKTITEMNGRFTVDSVPQNTKYLFCAYTNDTSLVFKDTLFTDKEKIDLGTVVMKAPGYIRGQVLLDSVANAGVLIFIPGTSFAAYSDTQGKFLMSQVVAGTYDLYYQYPNFVTGIDRTIVVTSLDTLRLPLKNLIRDTTSVPPAPKNVKTVYDTAQGNMFITWDSVTVADLKHFQIFRKKTTEMIPISLGYSTNCCFTDKLFTDLNDTHSYTCAYQVKSIDNQNNPSEFSTASTVVAASPTMIRTTFVWPILQNDTNKKGKPIYIPVYYSNKTRKNKNIRWFTGKSEQKLTLIKSVLNISTNSGIDTLIYTWQDTGVYLIQIEATDDASSIWKSRITLTIADSIILNPVDTFLRCDSLKQVRQQHQSVAVLQNTIYAIGGCVIIAGPQNSLLTTISSVESYSLQNKLWKPCKSMDSSRYQCASAATGGKIYVMGGMSKSIGRSDVIFSSIIQYEPLTDQWNPAGTLPCKIIGHAAIAQGDLLYIFGGFTYTGSGADISNQIYVYDTKTQTTIPNGTLLTKRMYHSAVEYNNKIYLIGGMDLTNTVLKNVEEYDPKTGICKELPQMHSARVHCGAAVLNGSIYAFGGCSSLSPPSGLKDMEVFSFEKNCWIWEGTKQMPSPRFCFSVSVLQNSAYIIGGITGETAQGQSSSVIKYNP